MAGIFISYRRDDSAGWAGRLATDLRERFGQEAVFQDIGAIEAGEDFIAAIERSVEACSVFLAVIGPDWTLIKDKAGVRRLDSPADTVRLEVATALQQKDCLVIPVLVGGARMPSPDELPPDLQELARRNAFELSDKRWDYDLNQLVASLVRNAGLTEKASRPTPDTKRARWIAVLTIATVSAGIILLTFMYAEKRWEWKRQNQSANLTYRLNMMRDCLKEFNYLSAFAAEAYQKIKPVFREEKLTDQGYKDLQRQYDDLENKRFAQNAKVVSLMVHFQDAGDFKRLFEGEYSNAFNLYMSDVGKLITLKACVSGLIACEEKGDLEPRLERQKRFLDTKFADLTTSYHRVVAKMKEEIGRAEDESKKLGS